MESIFFFLSFDLFWLFAAKGLIQRHLLLVPLLLLLLHLLLSSRDTHVPFCNRCVTFQMLKKYDKSSLLSFTLGPEVKVKWREGGMGGCVCNMARQVARSARLSSWIRKEGSWRR